MPSVTPEPFGGPRPECLRVFTRFYRILLLFLESLALRSFSGRKELFTFHLPLLSSGGTEGWRVVSLVPFLGYVQQDHEKFNLLKCWGFLN